MKRWITLLLCCVLMALAACAAPQELPEESPAPPVRTVSPAPMETPVVSITDGRVAADDSGVLWSIPNAYINAGLQQRIAGFGGELLVWSHFMGDHGAPVLRLALLSMADGALLYETELTGPENPEVSLCDNRIAVSNWTDGSVTLLSAELQTLETIATGEANCAVYPAPDGERMYIFTRNGGVRVTDGSGEELLLPEALQLYPGERCGDAVMLSYVDANTRRNTFAALDLASGKTARAPFALAFYGPAQSGGVWLAQAADDDRWLLSDAAGAVFTFVPESHHVRLLAEEARLLGAFYGIESTEFTLYSANGDFLSACEVPIPGAGMICEPLWLEEENGYLFVVTDETGSDRLFFWDLSAPAEGENLTLSPLEAPKTHGAAVSAALYDRALALGETYGLRIRIADLIAEECRSFSARQETDEEKISNALEVVEKALQLYPEGFFFQLPHGSCAEIELHLTGALTPAVSGENGFTSFNGFAERQEGRSIMAVDISGETVPLDTVHHEIMHLIDDRLEFEAYLRDDALYSEQGWAALNPAGFAYADSYNDLPENFYNDGLDGWFTELYSRTYAREDRATIMEYAVLGEEWIFSGAPGRQAKLEYLCLCIRDAFDTTGWPEETVWEQTLTESRN